MSDQEKMPYTRAFLQEIHRYRTVAPNAIPHCTSEDADLNGFSIPKGTTVSFDYHINETRSCTFSVEKV